MSEPDLPALSILDLSPISAGSNAAAALRNTLDLARQAESLGYARYWLSEHHNSNMLASAVPELLAGQIAAQTSHLRVGTGGIMLPNHAPLKVAESFRLLGALYPKRLDLGIGRAPGTDQLTALALRRSRNALLADDFPEQLDELLGFLGAGFAADHPLARIRAIPEGVPAPAIWLLGSSSYSARLAARLGLGFAFAHHIQPEPAIESMQLYHAEFTPSAWLSAPRSLMAVSALCAATDAAADELAGSADLTWLRFRQSGGQAGPVPSVAEARDYPYTPLEREYVRASRERMFVGAPTTLRTQLSDLARRAGTREVMVMSLIHAHDERVASYRLLAEAFALTPETSPALGSSS